MTRDNLIQLMAKAHLSYGRHPALRSPVPMQGDIDAMSAALAAIEAAGVRLVPVEATQEMTGAVLEPTALRCEVIKTYRAMLAASPYAALKETGQ